MKKYSDLQRTHTFLLDQEADGRDVTEDVLEYIKKAQRLAGDLSVDERDNLRANLRYWASYIFENKGEYPDTTLPPINRDESFTNFMKDILQVVLVICISLLSIIGAIKIVQVVFSWDVVSSTPPSSVILPTSLAYLQQFILLILYSVPLVISIFLWRNSGTVVAVRNVAVEIRKTMIGGGRRGKPLASLIITDGPYDMIGESLSIFTEKVGLGRDPKLADMCFYNASTKSSISGLHAQIERVNNLWRIVAISQSRSETFINNEPIPFDDPVPLHDGDTIRLGYLAQQPVMFTFKIGEQTQYSATKATRETRAMRENDDDIRKTDVNREGSRIQLENKDTVEDDIFAEFRLNNTNPSNDSVQDDVTDSIFDEYRDS